MLTIPKRRPKRLRILLDGSIETVSGQQDVRVRDISQGGVLIEAPVPPALGEKVCLACAGQRIDGVIVWQKGSWSGIEFDKPLSTAVWDSFARQPMRVGAPRNYRHDRIAADDEIIEVTPRRISLRGLFGHG